MPENCDILIRNARLRGAAEGLRDISIARGRIDRIGPGLDLAADTEIDAAGGLVTESFANPHLHLCKVWTLEMMHEDSLKAYREGSMGKAMWTLEMMHEDSLKAYREGSMGKAMSAIERASIVKENYDASWITENARRAAALAALHGNLHIRAFADVDSKARLEGVKGVLAVRDEFRGIVDIQVVAFENARRAAALAALHGNLHIRAFADVDSKARLEGVKGVLAVRDEFRGIVDIQVVAFAQDGIVREPGAEELLREAMELGADVVGGIPWIEFTDADAAGGARHRIGNASNECPRTPGRTSAPAPRAAALAARFELPETALRGHLRRHRAASELP